MNDRSKSINYISMATQTAILSFSSPVKLNYPYLFCMMLIHCTHTLAHLSHTHTHTCAYAHAHTIMDASIYIQHLPKHKYTQTSHLLFWLFPTGVARSLFFRFVIKEVPVPVVPVGRGGPLVQLFGGTVRLRWTVMVVVRVIASIILPEIHPG